MYRALTCAEMRIPWRLGQAGERREALGVDHKRLLYCVNVNCTSLDHLLLGEVADIDKLSNETSITPEESGTRMYFLKLSV